MKAKWSLRLVILADNEEWLRSTLCVTHLVEREVLCVSLGGPYAS